MPMIWPLGVDVDVEGAGGLRQAGHEHHGAGITTRNPAPAESWMSVMCSVHPVGAPMRLGSSESEYWVFAMQMGRWPRPHCSKRARFCCARSLSSMPAAP